MFPLNKGLAQHHPSFKRTTLFRVIKLLVTGDEIPVKLNFLSVYTIPTKPITI